ncbi:MAG: hypothetical protein AAGC43_07920 [Bacteroidota bacterium]
MSKATFHKVNEHVLIPILFILGSSTLFTLIYFVNELFTPEAYLKDFYLFDTSSIEEYKSRIVYIVIVLSVLILSQVLALKFKHWLLSALLVLISSVLLTVCIGYA